MSSSDENKPTQKSRPSSPSLPASAPKISSAPASSASSPPNLPAHPLQPQTIEEWWFTPAHILLPADGGIAPYPPRNSAVVMASSSGKPSPTPSRSPLRSSRLQALADRSCEGNPRTATPQEGSVVHMTMGDETDCSAAAAAAAAAAATDGSSVDDQSQSPPLVEDQTARQTRR